MQTFKSFKVLSMLGKGAYSQVYKVLRKKDQQIYALKKVCMNSLTKKEKRQVLNEVRLLASIKHPNIISYKQAYIDEATSCLCAVMEYADKEDASQLLAQHRNKGQYFTEKQIWTILVQAIKGLRHLHDLSIIHRDMKSVNLFLFENGEVKIGDLNASKVSLEGLGYTQIGTPYYLSPEIWEDEPHEPRQISGLSELCYLLFKAQSIEELYETVQKGVFEPIPNIYSTGLARIISAMIQTDPEDRPSCEQLMNSKLYIKRSRRIDPENLYDPDTTRCFSNDQSTNSEERFELLETIKVSSNLSIQENYLPKPSYDEPLVSLNPPMKLKKASTRKFPKNDQPIKIWLEDSSPQLVCREENIKNSKKCGSDTNNSLVGIKPMRDMNDTKNDKGCPSHQLKVEDKITDYCPASPKMNSSKQLQSKNTPYLQDIPTRNLDSHSKNALCISSINDNLKFDSLNNNSYSKACRRQYEEMVTRFKSLTPDHSIPYGHPKLGAEFLYSKESEQNTPKPLKLKRKVMQMKEPYKRSLLPSIASRKQSLLKVDERNKRQYCAKRILHSKECHSLEVTSEHRGVKIRYANVDKRGLKKMLRKVNRVMKSPPFRVPKVRALNKIHHSRGRV
ncbi:unnamed protein product [Moneuplotes crassus]|uniref:non-specific serine/threonine protein kinase n=1 Tax=Euplotes crassus TaxID=5936 RepID=A0AAD1Y792_EUPCR|nr:unnamed protein product [Moneuplotes crassus]